jgi:hypothetical protein
MMRLIGLLLVAMVLAAPTAAGAQDPTPSPTPTPGLGVPTPPPDEATDDGVLNSGEVPPPDATGPAQPCPTQGADGDYAYCGPGSCATAGADGDYAYCAEAGGAGEILPAHTSAPRRLPSGTLPYTGSEPLVVALLGLGLLLLGAGLRAVAPVRSAGRRP